MNWQIAKLATWDMNARNKKVILQWFWSELDHGVGPCETQLGADMPIFSLNAQSIHNFFLLWI